MEVACHDLVYQGEVPQVDQEHIQLGDIGKTAADADFRAITNDIPVFYGSDPDAGHEAYYNFDNGDYMFYSPTDIAMVRERWRADVAILTTDVFDATTVDPMTVALEHASARGKGRSGNYGSFEDVDGDGDLDLVIQIVNDIVWAENATEATLKGRTWDDVPIEGTDSVRIVPPE